MDDGSEGVREEMVVGNGWIDRIGSSGTNSQLPVPIGI